MVPGHFRFMEVKPMRIEQGFDPNCSEAVFRFYTEDPKVAHRILQAFAD